MLLPGWGEEYVAFEHFTQINSEKQQAMMMLTNLVTEVKGTG